MRSFKSGDKVTAHGLHGHVTYVSNDPLDDYPVKVMLDIVGKESFTLDGRAHVTHKEPELKMVKPAVPKKKTLYLAIETGQDHGSTRGGHKTSHAYPNRQEVVDMFSKPFQVVEIEIEVEE